MHSWYDGCRRPEKLNVLIVPLAWVCNPPKRLRGDDGIYELLILTAGVTPWKLALEGVNTSVC